MELEHIQPNKHNLNTLFLSDVYTGAFHIPVLHRLHDVYEGYHEKYSILHLNSIHPYARSIDVGKYVHEIYEVRDKA